MKLDKSILKLTGISAVIASLCCLSPLILVALGISSVSFAASLSNTLYFSYKWYFRFAGFLFLGIFLFFHYRKKGICTIDQVKAKRNKIINEVLLATITFIVIYIFFLYVVVEYIGKLYGIWG